jgi:hypothetical protein
MESTLDFYASIISSHSLRPDPALIPDSNVPTFSVAVDQPAPNVFDQDRASGAWSWETRGDFDKWKKAEEAQLSVIYFIDATS